ncbi:MULTISPECIES: hypothetical protein [Sphingobium]|nr:MULTISPECIES: hypothetical protein [Sphingobium]
MTSTPANDAGGVGTNVPCLIDMSVLDLAIFMRVHRAIKVTSAGEVSATLGHWFDCHFDAFEIEQRFRAMIGRGWLERKTGGVRPTIEGRRHGRAHLRGLVRMMDQGTSMLDVARMMSVLGIAMQELDGEHSVDD